MKSNLLAALLLLSPTPTLANDTISINIANPTPATADGYTFVDHILTLTAQGPYLLHGTTTENRVIVSPNLSADITLRNVSITSNTHSPFALSNSNCNVTLKLVGNNTLTSTTLNNNALGIYGAAIQVEGSASVTIEGNGSLTATGGDCGAGIGSGATEGGTAHVTGNIIIKGGNITATGVYAAAGIGGGAYGTGGNISIMGGNVIATGGRQGAAIGGGMAGAGGTIGISGGHVTATGGEEAAGIGGGATGNGGTINITGGVALAISGIETSGGGGAGIGGGAQAGAGNVSITGGSIFAFGNTGAGVGIGGGYGTTDGNVNISGGTVVANRIGIGGSYSGVLTQTSISNGAIIANEIATNSFGQAQVKTGVSLPLEVMQAMANNTPYGTTLHDTTLIHDTLPADTTRDTLEVHDTIYLDTALLRDTIHLDTTEVHDTVHLDTATIYDTIYLDTTELHDTLHADTAFVHDTTLIVDTTRIPVSIHDTTFIPVSVYDTTHTSAIIIDPTLPPETLLVTDTLIYDRPVDAPTYILLEDDGGGTGLPISVADNPLVLIPTTTASDLYYISGLDPNQLLFIYNLRGNLIAKADKMPVRIVGSGVFIVAQGRRYYKIVK